VKSYEKNYAVDSEAVENILQVDSLVPTAVRDRSLLLDAYQIVMIFRSRAHFQANWRSLDFAYLMLIVDSYARARARRLESGFHPFPTYFGLDRRYAYLYCKRQQR
jgi:hypothetical protein